MPSARTVLVDSGFWLALWDEGDAHNEEAKEKSEYLESLTILLPWPILYETVRTKFLKNNVARQAFESLMITSRPYFIDDKNYREDALRIAFDEARRTSPRHLSMCDVIIRLVIDDVNIRTDALLTFNRRDFVDVCISRRVEML